MNETKIRVRLAVPGDCEIVARMCEELWPSATAAEHGRELLPKIEGRATNTMPVVVFAAEITEASRDAAAAEVIGFIEVGLRSNADGCDESRAVGYLEGWFVAKQWRGQGVGTKLVAAAEEWARSRGCREMASDTWIDNEISQRAHQALGYEVVDRCVTYRKAL